MKKKSYNPFKMWGSYVGGLIILITLHYFYSASFTDFNYFNKYGIIDVLFSSLFVTLIGFTIGGLIHSLFRRLS